MGQTLYDKLFDSHVIRNEPDGSSLLYVDRHLVNEVTSPQAFESLRLERRVVWRPRSTIAMVDHIVPTTDRAIPVVDESFTIQANALRTNCESNGIEHYGMEHFDQGIVHVVGPEKGATLPGMTIVCGDSHTSTHGAIGALAFGIGTSEIEHVLATQTIIVKKSKSMRVWFSGNMPRGCSAKDLALVMIGRIGTAGATGYTIEYCGPVVDALTMEARMTLCNMSIEAGARSGIVAVDDTTLAYCKGRPLAPRGAEWDKAASEWAQLKSDAGARFDQEIEIDVSDISPQVTWGTSPEMVCGVDGVVPDPLIFKDASKRKAYQLAMEYMNLRPGMPIGDIEIDKIFIGSCTNGRIEDLRSAAMLLKKMNRKVASRIKAALVVPGSSDVKRQAEREGLDQIFKQAGFEWREPGCSMCLGMNADRLNPGERVASTSNRNFEGRQGAGGRSHLVSPLMAAAASIEGRFVDVRQWLGED
ncbi:3-isopropylmalate dehydratase large subunit [Burkholderia sp. BCC1977]|uniref:3-isopropylmalate dehydratase large subunit n=1 Tax=Burkholderia sp. BCC1977 TaxID=2817440 RepID=UPI002ABDDB2F|nr:3-isopropylmalate dehydratase large subunit [Burkholderia sp. BCC1977]